MSIAPPLVISNGLLVLPEGKPAPGSLRCEAGRIAAIGEVVPEPGDLVVEANGALVAPGLIDLGVFAIDKPAFHFGGITRAALMPDQSPPLDYPARVRFAAQSGKPDFWVHPLAAATRARPCSVIRPSAIRRATWSRLIWLQMLFLPRGV